MALCIRLVTVARLADDITLSVDGPGDAVVPAKHAQIVKLV